jgi:Carboxypeptidase regulatory-like domain
MRSVHLLPVVLVASATGCDGHTSVRGRVVDPAGKPLARAVVKMTEDPDNPGRGHSTSMTTDEDGQFAVGVTHAPTKSMPFLFEVTKDGFVGHSERLTGTASYEKEIVLQRAKK